ncbi:SusC/RagA family TonB-linked outer membrane protein [Flavobacterium sp. RNTU_13]|uniref:SusC/RagA family TonB-linked outer membrane protein n=1 Tax=Flavobacterium sp. RNTU_13 TaxID=3375145 RepID=UPI003988521F
MKFISANNGLRLLFYSSMLASFPCTALARAHASPYGVAYFQQTISGTVSDSSGPLPGVTVMVKGTNRSVVSDSDGKFSIMASPDEVLVFSFLGYKTVEVAVGSQIVLSVTLVEDTTQLEEVEINAGYYSVKKRESTGNISRITAKDIQNQPVTNVLSTIQGRMAGVNITQNTGVPGGGYNIQIRGTNSLRSDGNAPLYIIDGVPISEQSASMLAGTILPAGTINPLNAINPNDIESIEVLKDADATAIYGSRGGNGVVLVTTKKGKSGETSFSINSSSGFSKVASEMQMMNTQQYLQIRQQAFANDGIATIPDYAYDVNGTWDAAKNTNWQKELLGRTANNSMLQFSMNGGNDSTRFLISASHNEQNTVFSNDFKYKTNNLATNVSHRSQDQKFTLNFSGLFSAQSNNVVNDDLTRQALTLSPNAPALYNSDGSLNWEGNTFTNPVAGFESTYENNTKSFNTNVNLGYKLLPALSLKFNGGINYLSFKDMSLRPNTMYNPAYGITSESSMAFKGTQDRFSYLLEPQLQYSFSKGNHELEILAGATYQKTTSDNLNVEGYGFQSNTLLSNISAATTQVISQDSRTEYNYGAVFGRINYKYNQRYILNITGRRDGSSRFGPDNRFANFGALGGAWIFSKESFLSNVDWLNYGKLRGSFGSTGSDQIGDYQYLDTYSVTGNLYGNYTGLTPSRLYNPNFSWEKTTKLEAAVEAGLLNDRINITAAWYRNRSGNQLVGIPLPATTGFANVLANLPATVENKGWEFELAVVPVKSGNFRWETNFNINIPKNRLVAFPELEGSSYANRYVVGQPVSIVKLYNFEGLDSQTGLYQFTDFNGDGAVTSPEDNKVIKNVGVRYFGGISSNLSYKNWGLAFLFQFVKQNQWNYNSMMPTPGTMNNQPVEVLNVWSADNPQGNYMPYTSGANPEKNRLHNYFMNSTAAVSDASYIRLKNIQLNYRIPVNHIIKEAMFYVQGQNLLTFTKYFGLDPEFTQIGFLPPLKTVSFGVQLNF